MQTQLLHATLTSSSYLIGCGTNDGGIVVRFDMYKDPVVLEGNPNRVQLVEVERMNHVMFAG